MCLGVNAHNNKCGECFSGLLNKNKSNHFIFLRSSKDYHKRPGRVVGANGKGHLGVSCLRKSMCADGIGL